MGDWNRHRDAGRSRGSGNAVCPCLVAGPGDMSTSSRRDNSSGVLRTSAADCADRDLQ